MRGVGSNSRNPAGPGPVVPSFADFFLSEANFGVPSGCIAVGATSPCSTKTMG
jgi:hypothetical protein